MAAMVPIGIDFWASFRSPDLFEPAIIPIYRQRMLVEPSVELYRYHLLLRGRISQWAKGSQQCWQTL